MSRNPSPEWEPLLCHKMHGLGNDYVYLAESRLAALPSDLPSLARAVSERHTGIGADGLVVVSPSRVADLKMRIFNADGSEAQMCGNASRCIAVLARRLRLCSKTEMTLETLAGIKRLTLDPETGLVSVDMGVPTYGGDDVIAHGRVFVPVNMGNPHAVCFLKTKPEAAVVHTLGPQMERHEAFAEGANVEFARVLSPSEIEMRVWERGSGETMACGTGACATAVAAHIKGLTGRHVKVRLLGGTLDVEWRPDGHVVMTGPATYVAEIRYYPPIAYAQNED